MAKHEVNIMYWALVHILLERFTACAASSTKDIETTIRLYKQPLKLRGSGHVKVQNDKSGYS